MLAFDLAMPDSIIMPFVENGRMLKPIFAKMPAQYSNIVGHISELCLVVDISRTPAQRLLDMLTEREKTVATLCVSGKSRREIAQELFLSEGTVKNYLTAVYDKLHLSGSPRQKQHALTKILSETKKT